MNSEFTPIFLFILVAIATAVGMLGASALLGPKKSTLVKEMPYESGMDPIGDARQRFDVRYYLVAIVFLRSNERFTLPLGVQSFFQQNATDWGSVMAVAVVMMLPPVIVFAALNRYFSVGGVGGSLAGT